MAKIVAVCTSASKGERKKDVGRALLIKNHGLEGDAHAGEPRREVSLLSLACIEKMRAKGLAVGPGDFAENLTVEGMIDLPSLPPGTRLFLSGGPVLRVTQIGKKCHGRCAIYEQAGDCVMPREGIFAEVLLGGEVRTGDELNAAPPYRIGVLTVSDKGARGEREDRSGPLAGEILSPLGDVVNYRVAPDEQDTISSIILEMLEEGLDLLVTTGGTGLGPRDVTPEATQAVIERRVPGLPEAMRAAGLAKTPKAMLSRGIAGIRGRSLIVNLPGSPRGVEENLSVILPALGHALEIVTGRGGECGRG